MSKRMPYKAPPPEPTERRVYQLPIDLVKRVQQYGYENGHPSEVSAVRELLSQALTAPSQPDNTDGA